MIKLQNQYLTVHVNELGAELTSVKNEDGLEYIWQADPNYWNRHAPILFPIVGRLKNNQYEYANQNYSLTQHGFARDMKFSVVSNDEKTVVLELTSSEDTLKVYPFKFTLLVKYQLDEHKLDVSYQVINKDNTDLLFSIGAHPGFNVPLTADTDFEDYFVKFSPMAVYKRIPLEPPYSVPKKITDINLTKPLSLNHEMFNKDALVEVLNEKETSILIGNKKNDHGVLLTIDNAPYVGIWSPYPKQAPFVCIEPWWGLADTVDSDGKLTNKFGINKLPVDQQFDANFQITCF